MKFKNRHVPTLIAFVTAAFAFASLLAGCSQKEGEPTAQPPAESSEPKGTREEAPPLGTGAPEEPDPVVETEEPAPPPQPEYGQFGGVGYTFEGGVEVTVSAPAAFEPSEYAFTTTEFPSYLRFDVTVTNGSTEPFDPMAIYATLSSGGVEGEAVFDSDNGLGGTPQTTVLPGKSITWSEGWGVADPADLTYEIALGFEYEPGLFVGGV